MNDKTYTTEKLCEVIEGIDCLSQQGFSQIGSIARLSLLALESPGRSFGDSEDVASALKAIWSISENIQNSINCESEDVGCAYLDEGMLRRFDAIRSFENKS